MGPPFINFCYINGRNLAKAGLMREGSYCNNRQKVATEGADALPTRIAIVTGKGRGKDDDGASAAREAVAAILAAGSSPFQARRCLPPHQTSLCRFWRAHLAAWFLQCLARLRPLPDLTHCLVVGPCW